MKALLPIVLCTALALTLAGCNQEQETPPAPKPVASAAPQSTEAAAATVLLQEPIDLQRGETFADVLPVWRRFAARKPALLLLSNNPALLAPPDELRKPIDELLLTADDAQLRAAGDSRRPDPLFLPVMSVDMALTHGWFSKLVWAFPQRDPVQDLKLETMRDQLLTSGMASATEVDALQLDGKVFSGTLRSTPFSAAALSNLPSLEGPLLVHIDLSYFQNLYKNEIATPVITLVGNTLQQLAERKLQVLAVTLSYSHDQSSIPMNVRFTGDFVASLTAQPQQLKQPLQPVWKLQNDILYLENFFQKDEIRRLVEQQAVLAPKSAFAAYNRYHTATLFNEGSKALAELATAVALDPIYANEYPVLAARAYEAKHPDQALHMLQLASKAQPDNVWLHLQIASLANEISKKDVAGQQLELLRQQPWSPVYYPDMPDQLKQLTAPEEHREMPQKP